MPSSLQDPDSYVAFDDRSAKAEKLHSSRTPQPCWQRMFMGLPHATLPNTENPPEVRLDLEYFPNHHSSTEVVDTLIAPVCSPLSTMNPTVFGSFAKMTHCSKEQVDQEPHLPRYRGPQSKFQSLLNSSTPLSNRMSNSSSPETRKPPAPPLRRTMTVYQDGI